MIARSFLSAIQVSIDQLKGLFPRQISPCVFFQLPWSHINKTIMKHSSLLDHSQVTKKTKCFEYGTRGLLTLTIGISLFRARAKNAQTNRT